MNWGLWKEQITALRAPLDAGARCHHAHQRAPRRRSRPCALKLKRRIRAGVSWERAAQIQYGELPRLDAELRKLDAAQDSAGATPRMLKEEVDEEDVAKIVSKWTGIPVSRMLEGEVKKLVQMEDRPAGTRRRSGSGAHRCGKCHPALA